VRYVRLLANQARLSFVLFLQYRVDFFVSLGLACFWTLSALVPLLVLFRDRASVGGWTWAEALVVVGWFNVLKGVQSTVIQPSMQQAIEQIRKGTLDFVLIKPADSQVLISAQRFSFPQLADVVVGTTILIYAVSQLAVLPSPLAVLTTLVALVCAACILYSIWIMVMSLAFVFVKVDNLTFLFSSIYDAARFPATIYRGGFAFVFTFVMPLALMTTYPAMALLGKLALAQLAGAIGAAAAFVLVSRAVWRMSVARYTSAGG
jgi:ABC-2 type transport system permease protein